MGFYDELLEKYLFRENDCFLLQSRIRGSACDSFDYGEIEVHPECGIIPESCLQFLANSSSRILASTNGVLLCLSKTERETKLFLCNPITKSWLSIATPDNLQNLADVDYYFALEILSDDDGFMIVFLNRAPSANNYDFKVYSFRKRRWESGGTLPLSTGALSLRFDRTHVFCNEDVLYFISNYFITCHQMQSYCLARIMAYRLYGRCIRQLPMPPQALQDCDIHTLMGIYKWGRLTRSSRESICLVKFHRSAFSIWAMSLIDDKIFRDHDRGQLSECTWTKVLEISAEAMGLTKNVEIIGFTIMNNGDYLIFATKDKIYAYCLIPDKCEGLEEIGQHHFLNVSFTPFSSSLRSIGHGATAMPL